MIPMSYRQSLGSMGKIVGSEGVFIVQLVVVEKFNIFEY
jgi:hypothetical protein